MPTRVNEFKARSQHSGSGRSSPDLLGDFSEVVAPPANQTAVKETMVQPTNLPPAPRRQPAPQQRQDLMDFDEDIPTQHGTSANVNPMSELAAALKTTIPLLAHDRVSHTKLRIEDNDFSFVDWLEEFESVCAYNNTTSSDQIKHALRTVVVGASKSWLINFLKTNKDADWSFIKYAMLNEFNVQDRALHNMDYVPLWLPFMC